MFKIHIPKGNLKEKKYIIEYIFSQFEISEDINYSITDSPFYKLEYLDKSIYLKDIFLSHNNYNVSSRSDKIFALKTINYLNFKTFTFFGTSSIESNEKKTIINADIIGSAFWLLTRYEEFFSEKKDLYGRFLSSYSLLSKEYYLEPIVDQIVYLIHLIIYDRFKINFQIKGKSQTYLTHDIDHPYITEKRSFFKIIKSSFADIIIRKSISLSMRRLFSFLSRNFNHDPSNNIDWIVKQNNKTAAISIFFYIAIGRLGLLDTLNNIDDTKVINQFKIILSNNHQIGLHPSYLSSSNFDFLKEEKKFMEDVLNNKISNSRQHYLRFDIKNFWTEIEKAEISKDFSLGFPDQYGFRAGTCRVFNPFDVVKRKKVNVLVYSLLIMDTTLFKYLNASPKDIIKIHKEIFDLVKFFKGNFIILWHNTELMTNKRKYLYNSILKFLKL